MIEVAGRMLMLPEERPRAIEEFFRLAHEFGETWIIATPRLLLATLDNLAGAVPAAQANIHLYTAIPWERTADAQIVEEAENVRATGIDFVVGTEYPSGLCGLVVQSYATARCWVADLPDEGGEGVVLLFDSQPFADRFRRRFATLAASARRDHPDLNRPPRTLAV